MPTDLVVDILERSNLSLAVVTPAHQFPTGVVLAPRRRRELVGWALNGRLLIEDDYDAEYRYDRVPVPALHTSAPTHIAYTGSTSKSLAPGVRLGWLIAPSELRPALLEAKHSSDIGSPALGQMVLARLIESGDLERHVRTTRARQRERRNALVAAFERCLPEAAIGGIAAGLHLVVSLPKAGPSVNDELLAQELRAAGILVHPLSWHRMEPGPPGLLVGYAAHTPSQLRKAATRIAAVVNGRI